MKRWRTSCTRHPEKPLVLILCLAALTALASLASLAFGAAAIPPGEVLAAVLGRGGQAQTQIVLYARLPRLCGCLLAGAALAAAGVIIQGFWPTPWPPPMSSA